MEPTPNPKKRADKRRARRKGKSRSAFIKGKRKPVAPEPMIGGLTVDEFIARNADPIWLHQNEMWELMPDNSSCEPDEPEP